ncbi:glutamyl-tRNA reductase, partial [Candidatus Pacearchaeota archaeon]
VWGINHKKCPLEIREKLFFSAQEGGRFLEAMKRQLPEAEIVLLATCNRVECYIHTESHQVEALAKALEKTVESEKGIPFALWAPYGYTYLNEAVFRHLFRVAAGLDSMVVGENEILGQVRDAFQLAQAKDTLHSLLYRLMEKALQVGKEVRTRTRINQGAVSIPSVAVELALKIFGSLYDKQAMVLGAGEMATLSLKKLNEAGISKSYFASRNPEIGKKLAQELDSEWIPFDAWQEHMERIDILISSTSAPHPVVKVPLVQELMRRRRQRPLFLIDIAVPRDVEPLVQSIDDVYLYNLDDLKEVSQENLKRRTREIEAAQAIVEEQVINFKGWLEQIEARPVLRQFERYIDETIEKELRHLLSSKTVDAETCARLRNRLRAKLLHLPHKKIKEASRNGGIKR